MVRSTARIAAAAVLAAGCAHAAASGAGAETAAAPDQVPAGTLAAAQLRQPLFTGRSRPGDRFTADLLDPLVDARGREVAPRGTVVEGEIGARDAGGTRLRVTGLRREDEAPLPFPAEVVQAPEERPSALRRGLFGALAGAAAGAGAGLAADRQSGAVVGGASLVGAGVGALAGWLFGRGDAEIPAGSVLTVRVTQPFGSPAPAARRETAPDGGASE